MECFVEGLRGLRELVFRECRPASLIAPVYRCELSGKPVLVKVYSVNPFILKWVPAYVAALRVIRYRLHPVARLRNEILYFRYIDSRGLAKTPRVYAWCFEESKGFLVREHVEGFPVLSARDARSWAMYGASLRRLHSSGVALGDSNPGNFIVSGRELYLVDAEQAREGSSALYAWDLVVAVLYSLAAGVDHRLVALSLASYRELAGDAWEEVSWYIERPWLLAPGLGALWRLGQLKWIISYATGRRP